MSAFLVRSPNRFGPIKRTIEADDAYAYALRNSEITLSPRGSAAECYRTFEALEFGSLPLISDTVQEKCKEHAAPGYEKTTAPYRLFKLYDAPVMYLKNWTELPGMISDFEALSDQERTERRKKLFSWYGEFKMRLQRKVVEDVKRFFAKPPPVEAELIS